MDTYDYYVILNKAKKNDIHYNLTNIFGKSNTRTGAFLCKGNCNKKKVFIKITEVKSLNSPSVKEIKFYKLTNTLLNNNIINSVPYCYNNDYLKTDTVKIKNKLFSILITDDLVYKGYLTMHEFFKLYKKIPESILFELLYTLHTFDKIKLKHMDLHADNIYIKKLKEPINIQYEMIIDNNIKQFYVKTKYVLKVIDFDGSQKNSIQNKIMKNNFTKSIKNPESITGKSTKNTNRVNILKIVHTILHENIKSDKLLGKFWVKSNKGIPFTNKFKFGNFMNRNALNRYGLYIKNLSAKKIKFLKLNNSIVYDIKKIFKHILKQKIYIKKMKYNITYSQLRLLE